MRAPSIATLRAAVATAERAADDVLLSDDLACVTGAHDRALAAVRQARRALNDALVQQITDQAAAIVAAGQQTIRNLSREISS